MWNNRVIWISYRSAGVRRQSTAAGRVGALRRDQIVSRRAWEEYKQKHGIQRPVADKKSNSGEEASWPRSIQITGYVIAGLGIPYSLAWFVASNKSAREHIEAYIPGLEDTLRNHFGTLEQDELTYVEELGGQVPHSVLPQELTFQERVQEQEVQSLNNAQVPFRLTSVNQESQPMLVSTTKYVPGSTKATAEAVEKLAGETAKEFLESASLAVDFPDAEEDTLLVDNTQESIEQAPSTSLNSKIRLHSSWYFQPPPPDTEPRMSDEEVEVSRLEYEIEQLQRDLRDVSCTRSVDDMQRELREAKSQLRSLVWKRRLRFK